MAMPMTSNRLVALEPTPAANANENTIKPYRASPERHGVDTSPWWDAQLLPAPLGAFIQSGWEQALGDEEDLQWWAQRAIDGARYLS